MFSVKYVHISGIQPAPEGFVVCIDEGLQKGVGALFCRLGEGCMGDGYYIFGGAFGHGVYFFVYLAKLVIIRRNRFVVVLRLLVFRRFLFVECASCCLWV